MTPTEELMLEVLAARHRLGETTWTFSSRMKPAARTLEDSGYVQWQSGTVEKTIRVWLTDKGRDAVLSDTYASPSFTEGWAAAKGRLAEERQRVAEAVTDGETDMRFMDGVSHAWSVLFVEQP